MALRQDSEKNWSSGQTGGVFITAIKKTALVFSRFIVLSEDPTSIRVMFDQAPSVNSLCSITGQQLILLRTRCLFSSQVFYL